MPSWWSAFLIQMWTSSSRRIAAGIPTSDRASCGRGLVVPVLLVAPIPGAQSYARRILRRLSGTPETVVQDRREIGTLRPPRFTKIF
jgi:hypothetical protein